MNLQDDTYYIVHSWMINRLKLSGNELIVYAIIYSFSRDNKSDYHGGIDYLVEVSATSKNTVLRVLASLVKSGKILKESDGCFSIYKANLDLVYDEVSSQNGTSGKSQNETRKSQNETSTSPKMAPNNDHDNDHDNDLDKEREAPSGASPPVYFFLPVSIRTF